MSTLSSWEMMAPPEVMSPPVSAIVPHAVPSVTSVVPSSTQMLIPNVPIVTSVIPKEEIVLAPGVSNFVSSLAPSIPRPISGVTLREPDLELWNADVLPNFEPLFNDKVSSEIVSRKLPGMPHWPLFQAPVSRVSRVHSGLPEFSMNQWIDGPTPPSWATRQSEVRPSQTRSPPRGRSASQSAGNMMLVSRSPSRAREGSPSRRSVSPPLPEPVCSRNGTWNPVILQDGLEHVDRTLGARNFSPLRRQPEMPPMVSQPEMRVNGKWDPIVRGEGIPGRVQREGREMQVRVESLGYSTKHFDGLAHYAGSQIQTRTLDAASAAGQTGNVSIGVKTANIPSASSVSRPLSPLERSSVRDRSISVSRAASSNAHSISVSPDRIRGAHGTYSTSSLNHSAGSNIVADHRIKKAKDVNSESKDKRSPSRHSSRERDAHSTSRVGEGKVLSRTELGDGKILSRTDITPYGHRASMASGGYGISSVGSSQYNPDFSSQWHGPTSGLGGSVPEHRIQKSSRTASNSRDNRSVSVDPSRIRRAGSPEHKFGDSQVLPSDTAGARMQPYAPTGVSRMNGGLPGMLNSAQAVGKSGHLLGATPSTVQPEGVATRIGTISSQDHSLLPPDSKAASQLGLTILPSQEASFMSPSSSALSTSAASKILELVFDAPFDSIDKPKFKQDLLASFRSLGMTEATLKQLDVQLFPGSIIARVQGPPWAVTELQSKNLLSINIMGFPAMQIRQVPTLNTNTVYDTMSVPSVFDSSSTLQASGTTSSLQFESVAPTSSAFVSHIAPQLNSASFPTMSTAESQETVPAGSLAEHAIVPPLSVPLAQASPTPHAPSAPQTVVTDKAPERKPAEGVLQKVEHSVEELGKMSVNKLKDMLSGFGVAHHDCVEKEDLIARVQSHQAQGGTASGVDEKNRKIMARRSTLGSSWVETMEEEIGDRAMPITTGGGDTPSANLAVGGGYLLPPEETGDPRSKAKSGFYATSSQEAASDLAQQTAEDLSNPALVEFDAGLTPAGLNSQAIGSIEAGQTLSDTKPTLVRFDTPMKTVFTEKCTNPQDWLERFQVGDIKVGVVSQKGSKYSHDPTPNQDNYSLTRMINGILVYMVADGHGPFGHLASFHVCQALPYFLKQNLDNGEELEMAFKNAFDMTQIHLFDHGQKNHVDFSSSGSTATVAVQAGDEVLLGWLGDSKALLISAEPHPQSELWTAAHTPADPDELRRLQANGAECRSDGDGTSKRIYAPGQNYPGLCVSRAFGDFSVAYNGVISEPNIFPLVIGRDAGTLLMASDGVWDFIDDKKAIDVLYKDQRIKKKGPQNAIEQLCKVAKGRWQHHEDNYVDDITCLCLTWSGRGSSTE